MEPETRTRGDAEVLNEMITMVNPWSKSMIEREAGGLELQVVLGAAEGWVCQGSTDMSAPRPKLKPLFLVPLTPVAYRSHPRCSNSGFHLVRVAVGRAYISNMEQAVVIRTHTLTRMLLSSWSMG
eukprot:770833-Amphidinium_carterae.1